MIFKGTNIVAFKRASRGITKKGRSRIYYREKKKLERHSSLLGGLKDLIFGSNSTRNNFAKKKSTTYSISKKHTRTRQTNYVPKKTLLDDLREYRSPKIISHISNNIATVLVKMSCKNMSNDQKNVLRSAIAFIASETINKSLEKPLKVIDNIKMFIKVNKIVYKILMYFNEITNEYCVDEKRIITVRNNDSEYLEYLDKHPKIKQLEKKTEILDYLGKEVSVKVDRPLGSVHPKYSDLIYKTNYGHLLDAYGSDCEKQDAYVVGVDEPIQEYTGIVKAIIIHKNDIEDKLVVCSKDKFYSKDQINEFVRFQENISDIEIVM